MLKTVADYIRKHRLLERDLLHIAALSGGADSVALLLILRELGYRIEAAHCNFNLRGEESQRDEQFVKDLCKKENVPLHIIHFDTNTYAELHHVSIEMAARQLRYHYFSELSRDIGASCVCVAHHRDDSVETLLMNLIRGTGIHGLTGIRPRNGHVVRPLLCVSRKQIEDYLESRQQPYVTDSTNLQPDALRNKLRLNIIPLLCQTWTGANAAIAKTALLMTEAEKVYDKAIAQQQTQLVESHNTHSSIDVDKLLGCPSPESLLHETLTPYGFTFTQCQQMADSLGHPVTGKHYVTATHQVVIDRGQLLIAPLAKALPALKIPEPGNYAYQEGRLFKVSIDNGSHVSRQPDTATLDADHVTFPLTIRPTRPGDRFQPFGMQGSKLVSDYLTDRKLHLIERSQQLVITDADGSIVWLVGQRTAQPAAVTPTTKETLKIKCQTNNT